MIRLWGDRNAERIATRTHIVVAAVFLLVSSANVGRAQNAPRGVSGSPATSVKIVNPRELSSLDLWIVQRYRGAQLLPDSGTRTNSPVRQAGAPRVESTRTPNRRDTVVALHFEPAYWRSTLGTASLVQLADPTGVVSSVSGRVTARRAFRSPRVAGARDSVAGDWRIGWAYLVAIPTRSANAAASGFNGWALVETPAKNVAKVAQPDAQN